MEFVGKLFVWLRNSWFDYKNKCEATAKAVKDLYHENPQLNQEKYRDLVYMDKLYKYFIERSLSIDDNCRCLKQWFMRKLMKLNMKLAWDYVMLHHKWDYTYAYSDESIDHSIDKVDSWMKEIDDLIESYQLKIDRYIVNIEKWYNRYAKLQSIYGQWENIDVMYEWLSMKLNDLKSYCNIERFVESSINTKLIESVD